MEDELKKIRRKKKTKQRRCVKTVNNKAWGRRRERERRVEDGRKCENGREIERRAGQRRMKA